MSDSPIPKPPVSHLDQLAQKSKEAEQTEEVTPEETPVEETPAEPEVSKDETEASDEEVTIIFDESSASYLPGVAPYNLEFVRTAANALNHQLQVRGHLFLNDLNDYLGLKRTPDGQRLGWIANDNAPARLTLGIVQEEENFILTPNVQGVIWDKI